MAPHTRAFNIPTGVLAAGLAMVMLHALRLALPKDQGIDLLLSLAFIPARYAGTVIDIPGGDIAALTSFVTYMFVHGDWTHLLINVMWMLAFGSAVAKRVGSRRFLLFSALCGIIGIAVHLLFHFGDLVPVVGASAAISGQMAGAVRFMFGARQPDIEASGELSAVPLAGIGATLSNPRFLIFLAIWVLLNILFGLGAVQLDANASAIAWEAHIGGFLCGLFSFGVFDRQVGRRIPEHLD